jgi:hypothetical protein
VSSNDPTTEISVRALLDAWEQTTPGNPVASALALLAVGSELDERALGALSLGERDRRLFALRERLFGPRLSSVASCPRCEETVELACNVRDLLVEAPPPDEAPPPRQLVVDGHEISFRLLTSADLLAIAERGWTATAAESRSDEWRRLLDRCVVSASRASEPVAPSELPVEIQLAVVSAMAAADEQADVEMNLVCPACGEPWSSVFDIASYLGDEMDAWARRMLADVHTLARRYGWSEAAILSMSAHRRRLYLEFGDA